MPIVHMDHMSSYEQLWQLGCYLSFHLTHWQPRQPWLNRSKRGWKNTQPTDFLLRIIPGKKKIPHIFFKKRRCLVFGVLCVWIFLVLCNDFKGDKTLAKEGIGIWMSKGIGIVTYWKNAACLFCCPTSSQKSFGWDGWEWRNIPALYIKCSQDPLWWFRKMFRILFEILFFQLYVLRTQLYVFRTQLYDICLKIRTQL